MIREEFLNNIIITGGTSMFEGMKERLTQEIKKLAPNSFKVQVEAPVDRKFGAWTGASVMCSMQSFNDSWMTREEYDDDGPSAVHKKSRLI
eukprot:gene12595-6415_t